MTDTLKRFKNPSFLGRQLSRLKLGQSYYVLVTATMTAFSLLKLAFPSLDILLLILLFPFILLGTFFIGYYLDINDINTNVSLKADEMAHRYRSTSDKKNQDFHILLMKLHAKMHGKDTEFNTYIDTEYSEYIRKWTSDDSHS